MAWRKKDRAAAEVTTPTAEVASEMLGMRLGTGTVMTPQQALNPLWLYKQTQDSLSASTLMREYAILAAQEQAARMDPVPPGPSDLPSPTKIAVASDMAEYVEAAHAVGFRSPEVERIAFMRELQDVGCEVYDYDRVDRFLRAEAAKEAQRIWVWKPVTGASAISNRTSANGGYSGTTYSKLIPIEALRLMKIVADRVPDVRFYVSDYEVRNPDPFLLVMRSHDVRAVILHWDEPSFRVNLA